MSDQPDTGLSNEQVGVLLKIAANPQAAINALPEAERRKYEEAQESVLKARRAGQRLARNIWID